MSDRNRRTVRSPVPEQAIGQALGTYLAARFTYRSEDQWSAEIADGNLRINDAPTTPDYRLAAGDEIVYDAGRHAEPPVPTDWAIVYEDPSMLIVDKPAGLPSHPSGAYFAHTLSEMVRSSHPEARIVNRLDRETSGLVVFGLSKSTAGALGKQFAARSVDKRYLVVVHGAFPDDLTADGFLERDSDCEVRKKRRFVTEPGENAESAHTVFRRLAEGDGLSLVEAHPETGRLHQIRATLCSLGFPVVGDKIYGLDPGFFLRFIANALTAEDKATLRLENQALHAHTLTLRGPHTGAELTVEAKAPSRIEQLFNA